MKRRKECGKCQSRAYKEKKPFRYYFNTAKQSAKRRHIPWELSFQQFKQLWLDSGKWEEKLQGNGYWSIDRIDVNGGYEMENVRIISVALNVEVWWTEDRWQVDFRWRKRWSERNNKPIEDCPF